MKLSVPDDIVNANESIYINFSSTTEQMNRKKKKKSSSIIKYFNIFTPY